METGKGKEQGLDTIYDGFEEANAFIVSNYTNMFEKILDMVEDFFLMGNVDNGEQIYKNLRAKILRKGNNAIREFEEFICNYTINKKVVRKDIIEFGQQKK